MWPAIAILAFVTFQRLAELALAKRNTARLLAAGAREYAPRHYPLMVAFHAAWLIGLWLLAPGGPVHLAFLSLFLLLQVGRVWVIRTLGPRWTTRIIILPEAALVTGGPYRFVNHPNYVVVVGEVAILPLVFGLWAYALLFSLVHLVVLTVRIRAENRALAQERVSRTA